MLIMGNYCVVALFNGDVTILHRITITNKLKNMRITNKIIYDFLQFFEGHLYCYSP
jgi:hypothetical protein